MNLLSIPETAERLSCSRWHVYDLISDGELQTTDIRRAGSTRAKTRVHADSVDELIKRRGADRTKTAKTAS